MYILEKFNFSSKQTATTTCMAACMIDCREGLQTRTTVEAYFIKQNKRGVWAKMNSNADFDYK